MGQFGSFIKKIEVSLKVFPGAKVSQLNNHIIHLVEITTPAMQQPYMSKVS